MVLQLFCAAMFETHMSYAVCHLHLKQYCFTEAKNTSVDNFKIPHLTWVPGKVWARKQLNRVSMLIINNVQLTVEQENLHSH